MAIVNNSEIRKQKRNELINELSFHPENRIKTFLKLSKEYQLEIILRLSTHIKKDILSNIPENTLLAILEEVDPDDATDLLQLLSKRMREKTLQNLSQELRDTVSRLLKFDPETAAGLMNVDYIKVDVDDTIEVIAKKFKQHERRTGRLPVILAMDGEKLAGFFPGHELGFARTTEKIRNYVMDIPSISQSASHDDVTELFATNPQNRVAVIDSQKKVVGIIYADDVLKLMQEQESASLYDFAGVSAEENVTDSAGRKVKFRYKWLIINLATAFLAAATVGLFEGTISKYVLLAVYMPIVAGMGGNAATQTLAVVVRGIALHQVDIKTAFETLKNEVGAGFINGLINGALVATIITIKDHDYKIAVVLGLAMVINLLVASFFGTIVPLIMSKLKKDPASSATIFITTATDVLGFLVFLGLAQLILE